METKNIEKCIELWDEEGPRAQLARAELNLLVMLASQTDQKITEASGMIADAANAAFAAALAQARELAESRLKEINDLREEVDWLKTERDEARTVAREMSSQALTGDVHRDELKWTCHFCDASTIGGPKAYETMVHRGDCLTLRVAAWSAPDAQEPDAQEPDTPQPTPSPQEPN
jgi:hypothetical protein